MKNSNTHTHTHTHTHTPEQGDKKNEIQMPKGGTGPSPSELPKSKPPKSVLEEVEVQWTALLDVFGCRDVGETQVLITKSPLRGQS